METKLDDNTLVRLLQAVDNKTAKAASSLAGSEDERSAIKDLSESTQLLALAGDELNARPLPHSIVSQVENWQPQAATKTSGPWVAIAASALLAAVIAGVGGWQIGRTSSSSPSTPAATEWVQAVLDYQILYTRATLEQVKSDPDRRASDSQRLSQALGAPLEIPDLSDDGLEFKRGQILGLNDQPVVQIVYLPVFGSPVAYCLSPQPGPDRPIQVGTDRGLDYVTWRRNGLGHVLVGRGTASLSTLGERLSLLN